MSRRQFEQRLIGALLLADALACLAAVWGSYALRRWPGEVWWGPLQQHPLMYAAAMPLVWLLWVVAFHANGLYEYRRAVSPVGGPASVLKAAASATVLIAGASFLSHITYSRAILLLFWMTGSALGTGLRLALVGRAVALRRRGYAVSPTLVVGCGELAHTVAQQSEADRLLGFRVVGLVRAGDEEAGGGDLPVLGGREDLPRLVRELGIEEVVVAHPGLETGELMTLVAQCEAPGLGVHVVGGPLAVLAQGAEIAGMGDLPVVELRPARLVTWQQDLKRLGDVVLGGALLVLTGPAVLVLMALVKLESPGPAVFRQQRVGQGGRPFTMLKLRTMRAETEPYADAPEQADDQRVTRLGRWLRRTSLDELPQLVNVLRGEMSLVGPRPEMPYLVARYEPWQRLRLEARPGLTGLWQVMGRKDIPLRENLQYDFYYVRNWSVWLDAAILLRTAGVVLGGRGAY